MTAHRPTIPHPSNAPPPPPGVGLPQSNHAVQADGTPSDPYSLQRVEEDSPYKDMGNPWADAGPRHNSNNNNNNNGNLRPALSSAAHTGTSLTTTAAAGPDVPDVLKPGWSAQNTPRSSIDSDRSRDFWESSGDEAEEGNKKAKSAGKERQDQKNDWTESTEDLVIPSPLKIKRKPVGFSHAQTSKPTFKSSPPKSEFSSNNPFRRSLSTSQQAVDDLLPSWEAETKDKGKGKEPVSAPTTHFQSSSLNTADDNHYAPYNPDQPTVVPDHLRQYDQRPQQPLSNPPPIPIPKISSPFSEQPPLIPVSPKAEDTINPWAPHQSLSGIPSSVPFSPSQKQNTYSTDNLLDRGSKAGGRVSLAEELRALPNAAQSVTSQVSLLDDDVPPQKPPRPRQTSSNDQYTAPPGPPPSHATRHGRSPSPAPPTKPPRPAMVVNPPADNESADMQQQRNETYQIKHFNWFDNRSNKLRTSSMLTQNKNGPCPLLALVNALILGANDESQAALDDALRSREQVTLGLIIETLMDEMLTRGIHLDGDLPDVDEVNRFLIKLRTGMNMNPRFAQPRSQPPNLMDARNSVLHMPTGRDQDQPGNFEPTQDLRLYSAFGIKTVHGWLPEPGSEEGRAFARSAQNYEDAQVIQFGEEELDYKLSNGGLSTQEQQLWEDIVSIKNFFQAHPTQLTPYGLSTIQQSMQPGTFAILFRNDHFSTIYKHPRDGSLYTLITDAGYADRDEVIWESLVDISGQQSDFLSGDFQSVSHHFPDSERRSSHQLSVHSNVPEPLSPQQQQEQHDADFAMALQLQEEEEQRMRQQRNSRSSQGGGQSNRDSGRDSGTVRRGQGIPITLRSNNSGSEHRPLIPPRNQRNNAPAVNRPADSSDTDAPPTYEEAARGKPYNPPLGSPLHPQSSASAEPTPYNSSSNVALPEAVGLSSEAEPALRRPQRRQSAYNENTGRGNPNARSSSGRFEAGMSPAYSDRNSSMPGTYVHAGRGGQRPTLNGGGSIPNMGGRRRDDNECSVM